MALDDFPSRQALAVAGLLLLGAAGCGRGLYSVRGKVTYPDGTPLTAGMVVFECQGTANAVTARGELRGDGSFELGTQSPGDGAPPGKYRVLVAPKYDPNAVDRPAAPPPIDRRYTEFSSSGLEFEVTPDGPNDFPIRVTRPPR
jgi:hypothetical protein